MSGGIPWAPQGRPDNTIAQMILQAGRDRAEGLRRGSAITANALGSLGDIAQGYYQQKREDKDKALKLSMLMEDRQRAQKLGDLQYQGEEIDLQKKKKEQEQDALVSSLLSSGQPPTMETMTKAGVDPQRAMAISTGFMSLQSGALRRFGDINELQKATARGILALPEAQRPQAYDIALQSYKTNGIDTSHIPPQYDPGAVEAAAGYGEDPVAKKQAEEDRKYNRSRQEAADKRSEAQLELSRQAAKRAGEKLVQVDMFDPETKKNVRTWVRQSELDGKTVQKPIGSASLSRAESAETVDKVGTDLIAKLTDAKFDSALGPVLGRFNTVRDFIGAPPPQFAELAGEIESFSLANMGVHGMRSAQGAQKIKEMLDQKLTPSALSAKIKGLLQFAKEFQGTVYGPGGSSTPAKEETWTKDANGRPVLVKK